MNCRCSHYLTALAMVFVLNSLCMAETYYVRNGGNDQSNGTSDAMAWKTLSHANSAVVSGDTLLLKRGSSWSGFSEGGGEDGLIYINNKSNVTIDSYGEGSKPIIDRTGEEDPDPNHLYADYTCVEIRGSSSNIHIRNLDLRGADSTSALYTKSDATTNVIGCDFRGSGWSSESLVLVRTKSFFENCFFDQITGNTTGYSKSIELFYGDASGSIIRSCVFRGFGPGGAVRFSNEADDSVIENNYFFYPDSRRTNCWALVVRSQGGGTVIIRNNVFNLSTDSGPSGSSLRAMAFWDDHSSTTRKIFNNTIISNGKGTGVHGYGAQVLLYNNIFYSIQTGYDNPGNVTARNNIFYNVVNKVDGSFSAEYNSITSNPHLYNPTMSNNNASDASLTSDSDAAIDSAYQNDPDIPTVDHEGLTRDSAVDIGAFEYSGGSPSNQPAQASFNATPTNGPAPLTVQFTDTSTDPDGTIASWSWVFGDGGTSTDQHPAHTYDNADTYTATLTVTDNDGAPDSASTAISVSDQGSNQPPQASFTATPSSGEAPLTVQFTDTSTDPDGTVSSWNWNFGDGGTSTQQNPTHTYDNASTYTVTLTATDNDGAPDSASTTIPVSSGETTSSYVEAESGTLYSPMTIGNDPNPPASGGSYVYAPAGTGSTTNPTAEAVYNIDIPYDGDYYLWLRMYGPSGDNDAIYIGFNGSFDRVYVTQWTEYEWVRVETSHGSGDFSHTLSAGTNHINIGHGEELARADIILMTNDAGYSPTDDTTDPIIAITQPTSGDVYSTEEDTVDLGGSASDDVGVTSVTWTNSRAGSGTASGTQSWTVSGISLECGDDNVLTVTAQDAAGNSSTDTLTVDVKPCTPSGFDTQ